MERKQKSGFRSCFLILIGQEIVFYSNLKKKKKKTATFSSPTVCKKSVAKEQNYFQMQQPANKD